MASTRWHARWDITLRIDDFMMHSDVSLNLKLIVIPKLRRCIAADTPCFKVANLSRSGHADAAKSLSLAAISGLAHENNKTHRP
jgi:hypothetical protein